MKDVRSCYLRLNGHLKQMSAPCFMVLKKFYSLSMCGFYSIITLCYIEHSKGIDGMEFVFAASGDRICAHATVHGFSKKEGSFEERICWGA